MPVPWDEFNQILSQPYLGKKIPRKGISRLTEANILSYSASVSGTASLSLDEDEPATRIRRTKNANHHPEIILLH